MRFNIETAGSTDWGRVPRRAIGPSQSGQPRDRVSVLKSDVDITRGRWVLIEVRTGTETRHIYRPYGDLASTSPYQLDASLNTVANTAYSHTHTQQAGWAEPWSTLEQQMRVLIASQGLDFDGIVAAAAEFARGRPNPVSGLSDVDEAQLVDDDFTS